MIVYKVVRGINSQPPFFSSTVRGENQLEYSFDSTTKPKIKGSPLMAFDSFDSAKQFVSCNHNHLNGYEYHILLCSATETPAPRALLFCPNPINKHNDISHFWQNFFKGPPRKFDVPVVGRFPKGTVFCSSITPETFAAEKEANNG